MINPTLSLIDLRRKLGRIETFAGKLAKGDSFILKNGKQFQADSIVFMGSNNKEIAKFTPRSDYEVTKLISYMKTSASLSDKILVYSLYDENNKVPLNQLKTTGEFGFKTDNYRDSMEDYQTTQCRTSLAKAIAMNRGPINIVIHGIKYYDICDVISSYSKNQKFHTKADMEFINRYGQPLIWVSTHKNTDADKRKQSSDSTIQQSSQCQQFIQDVAKKFPDGLTSGTILHRKFERSINNSEKMRAVYGPYYDGSKRYNEQNVTLVSNGAISITKSAANTFRIIGSNLKCNGDDVSDGVEPLIVARFDLRKNDYGIQNCEISIDNTTSKIGQEF